MSTNSNTTNNITEIRIPEHEVKSIEEVELSSFLRNLVVKILLEAVILE